VLSSFIISRCQLRGIIKASGLTVIRNLLDDGKAVANTRVGARDEREQVAEDTRKRSNGFRNGFPTFWSARCMSIDGGEVRAQVDDAHLNSSASSPHTDFNLCTARIGMTTKSPFFSLRDCVQPCELSKCDLRLCYAPNFMSLDPVSVGIGTTHWNYDVFLGDSFRL
jgi:hypothetical protein